MDRRAPEAIAIFFKPRSRAASALATYRAFTPGRRRDYVEWILDAKREETRKKRIATAVEWMADGKERNWKYRSS